MAPTFGLDYRPALVNREGIGRATRELVRGLAGQLSPDEALGLFGWTLRAPRYRRADLGLPERARLHRRRFPARWTNAWLGLTGGVDRALGAAVFHDTQPRRLPTRRAKRTTMIWDLLFLDANGQPGGPWVARDTAHAMAASARAAADSADLLFVPTEFVRNDVIAKLGVAPERVRTVGLGADHLPAPALDLLLTRPPFLLTVARIDPRKNHALVLAAFERMFARGLPHHWLVVGPRGWRADEVLAAIERSPARERISVIENATDAELSGYLEGASAFVFPSRGEGFGLPPVEAQRAGTPVVALATSCLPEVLGDGAAWIAPGTPDEEVAGLEAALERALFDTQARAALIAAGHANAARHTWAASAAAHLAGWRALL